MVQEDSSLTSSPLKPGFYSMSAHMGFMVNKVPLGQSLSPSVCGFPCRCHSTSVRVIFYSFINDAIRVYSQQLTALLNKTILSFADAIPYCKAPNSKTLIGLLSRSVTPFILHHPFLDALTSSYLSVCPPHGETRLPQSGFS